MLKISVNLLLLIATSLLPFLPLKLKGRYTFAVTFPNGDQTSQDILSMTKIMT